MAALRDPSVIQSTASSWLASIKIQSMADSVTSIVALRNDVFVSVSSRIVRFERFCGKWVPGESLHESNGSRFTALEKIDAEEQCFASGSETGKIVVWKKNANRWLPSSSLNWHLGPIKSLLWDGDRLFSSSEECIQFWHPCALLDCGWARNTLTSMSTADLLHSFKGRIFASHLQQLVIYSIVDGILEQGRPLVAHDARITALGSSKDRFFSASQDGVLKIWEGGSSGWFVVSSLETPSGVWVQSLFWCAPTMFVGSSDGSIKTLILGNRLESEEGEWVGDEGQTGAHEAIVKFITSNELEMFSLGDDMIVQVWRPRIPFDVYRAQRERRVSAGAWIDETDGRVKLRKGAGSSWFSE